MEEVWKDVKDFIGIYQVSNLGRVRSLERVVFTKTGKTSLKKGKLLKNKLTKSGYYSVHFRFGSANKYPTVHRLVAEAFIGNSDEKATVNHIDGDKTNNHVSNLEWSTYKEQSSHAISTGLHKPEGPARYSKEFKKEILEYYNNNNISIAKLASHFSISERTAGRIVNNGVGPRKTTRVLKTGERIVENILSKEDVEKIKALREEGYTLAYIAGIFNRGISQIHRITKLQSRTTNIE